MTGQEITELRNNKNLTQMELANLSGIPLGTIGRIEANKNEEVKKASTLEKLLSVLSPTNPSGGLAFNGTLVGDFNYPRHTDQRVVPLLNGKFSVLVPIIPERGYAGTESGWSDPEYIDTLPRHQAILTHEPAGEYWACEATGVSMENWTSEEMAKASIRDGEIVTGRNIDKKYWTSRFHLHKYKNFIIIHQEGILIKRIIGHDVENGIIRIHSLNPNKDLYPDRDIDLREVTKLLNIVDPLR